MLCGLGKMKYADESPQQFAGLNLKKKDIQLIDS